MVRYVFLRRLGQTVEADLAHVWDRWLARDALLKAARAGPDRVTQELRLICEARRTAWLCELHVPQVLDLGWLSDGRPYLTMEWIRGVTLRESIDRDRRSVQSPNLRSMLAVLAAAACVVDAAHTRGVVHRDLKPEHVVSTTQGSVILLDWGLAAPIGRTSCAATLAGTPHYMAPERGLGAPTHPAEDVYSLGVMLFEILTGQVPHANLPPELVGEASRQGVSARAPPGSGCAPTPDALLALVEASLDPEPARRPHTALEFAHAIESFLHTTPADPR